MSNILEKILYCPECRSALDVHEKGVRCTGCGRMYSKHKGAVVFFHSESGEEGGKERTDGIIFRLKAWVKKNPRLFHVLNHILGIYVGRPAKQAIAHLQEGAVIVNIGSGSEIIRDDVINLDATYHSGVHVVADAHHLPFADDSVDAVVCESMLEHVRHPDRVVHEMLRILKPGGLAYVVVPFVIGYHSSPGDYYRWTTSGFRELMKDFREDELGIAVGPTNAMTYILREWLALILSFNSRILHQLWILFFMVLFAPLNLLDFILKGYSASTNIAHLYYFIGRKKIH